MRGHQRPSPSAMPTVPTRLSASSPDGGAARHLDDVGDVAADAQRHVDRAAERRARRPARGAGAGDEDLRDRRRRGSRREERERAAHAADEIGRPPASARDRRSQGRARARSAAPARRHASRARTSSTGTSVERVERRHRGARAAVVRRRSAGCARTAGRRRPRSRPASCDRRCGSWRRSRRRAPTRCATRARPNGTRSTASTWSFALDGRGDELLDRLRHRGDEQPVTWSPSCADADRSRAPPGLPGTGSRSCTWIRQRLAQQVRAHRLRGVLAHEDAAAADAEHDIRALDAAHCVHSCRSATATASAVEHLGVRRRLSAAAAPRRSDDQLRRAAARHLDSAHALFGDLESDDRAMPSSSFLPLRRSHREQSSTYQRADGLAGEDAGPRADDHPRAERNRGLAARALRERSARCRTRPPSTNAANAPTASAPQPSQPR